MSLKSNEQESLAEDCMILNQVDIARTPNKLPPFVHETKQDIINMILPYQYGTQHVSKKCRARYTHTVLLLEKVHGFRVFQSHMGSLILLDVALRHEQKWVGMGWASHPDHAALSSPRTKLLRLVLLVPSSAANMPHLFFSSLFSSSQTTWSCSEASL